MSATWIVYRMSPPPMTEQKEAWELVFEALASRLGEVDLTPLDHASDDRLAPAFRTRLLYFDEGGFVLELPGHVEARRYLSIGTAVSLLGVQDHERWECFTAVSGTGDFAVKGHGELSSIELSWPSEVRSAQRRRDPRVNIAGVPFEPVVLFPIAPVPQPVLEKDDPTPEAEVQAMLRSPQNVLAGPPRDPFEATLLNIGTGGIGVEIPPSAEGAPRHFTRYRVVITLPSTPHALVVQTKVAHRQPMVSGNQYLGLAFDTPDKAQRRTVSGIIAELIAWVQRNRRDASGELKSGEPAPLVHDDPVDEYDEDADDAERADDGEGEVDEA